jgi:hypothetical protein
MEQSAEVEMLQRAANEAAKTTTHTRIVVSDLRG